jgi:hypothetical protein
MNDPELYPHGPHMQFNFGENRELSLEISYHDAVELKAKIEDFLRTAEKAYIEQLNAGKAGPIGKIPDATLCARCGAQYKHHGLVGRNCPTGIPSSRWSKETFVLPKPITICHPGQAENEGQ